MTRLSVYGHGLHGFDTWRWDSLDEPRAKPQRANGAQTSLFGGSQP